MLLISKIFLWLMGWKMNLHGLNPKDFRRVVMLAIPHTSNWDLPIARAAFFLMDVHVRFTVKKEWMRFPYSLIAGPLGGIAIDRSPKVAGQERKSMTEAMVDLFEQNPDELAIMITPEGTRSLNDKWKTGFYHVAKAANVPICLGYVDYGKKLTGITHPFMPSEYEQDMKKMMDFYQTIEAKFPEKFAIDKSVAE
jgi:1-acyl-sn-glycerol-3-phosphate acyltransferase